jgi:hypothetical protein
MTDPQSENPNAPKPELPPDKVTQLPLDQAPPADTAPPAEPPAVEKPAVPIANVSEIVAGDAGKAQTPLTDMATAPPPDDKATPATPELHDEAFYRGLDWSKSNSKLANETGVTRQRIQQVRQKLFGGNAPPSNIVSPDFSDLGGASAATTAVAPIETQKVVDYTLLASSTFDMTTGTLVVVFGEEWKARSPEEREIVCNALAVYFKSKNVQDIPPGLMLTVVCLAYALPRLRAPNTSSKLKLAWTWLRTKLASFRMKKAT